MAWCSVKAQGQIYIFFGVRVPSLGCVVGAGAHPSRSVRLQCEVESCPLKR